MPHTLLLRLHTETAGRGGRALALRQADLDPDQCLILLREKGETVRWQDRDTRRTDSCCGTPMGGRSRLAGKSTAYIGGLAY